jgi:His-Xaa-Ser repeat protein HxsA
MKAYALIAALALATPALSEARDHHRHHSGHHHGGIIISRHVYPSYGYGYGYRSPYRYGYSPYSYGPSLNFVYSSSSTRSYRSESDYDESSLEVDVQQALRRRGYYDGPIDGDIGPGSRSAIRAYQADRGLSVTGRIDSSLLRALGI